MKSLKNLEVYVPQLGIKHASRAIGGYCGGYAGYYGGMLNESMVVAYRSSNDGWDDFWVFEDPSSRNNPYFFDADSTDWGWDHSGCGPSVEESDTNDGGVLFDGITFDSSLSSEDVAEIYTAILCLPEGLRPTNVRIIVDPELLQSLSQGEYARGCYLHKYQLAPKNDNTYFFAEEDIIVLKGTNVDDLEGLMFEEYLHLWQHKNCKLPGAKDTNTVQAMEFQVDVIQTLMALENEPNSPIVGLNYLMDKLISIQDYPTLVMSGYPNNLSEYMSSIFSQISQEEWSNYYNEWSIDNHSAPVNDTYYDWKWDELFELLFPNSQYSGNNGSPY